MTTGAQAQARRLQDYEGLAPSSVLEGLQRLGERLKGVKILHINSTRVGGGVAEILTSLVPLSSDVGPETRWAVIEGPLEFFEVTKTFHNALQGEPAVVTPEQLELWQRVNEKNARTLREALEWADVVFVHDYQPLALVEHRKPPKEQLWLWRCHIELVFKAISRLVGPQPSVWELLQPYVERFDGAVFSMGAFAPGLSVPQHVVPPSIDPLSDKNRELPEAHIEAVYTQLELPLDRKAFLQVSRFDRFKDPIGVIRAYELFKRAYGLEGETCLVLAGGGATDDPEGARVLREDLGVREVHGEAAARTTWENARNTARWLRARGWRRILLVTHAWHMRRALQSYAGTGIDVVPAPTGFSTPGAMARGLFRWWPSADALAGTTRQLHEILGRLWYRLRHGAPDAR